MRLDYETPPPPPGPREGARKWLIVGALIAIAVACGYLKSCLSVAWVPSPEGEAPSEPRGSRGAPPEI
jgi:hypothetical protein